MSARFSDIEKRRYKRVKTNFISTYEINKPLSLRINIGLRREANALMLDLSEKGVSLLTDYDIPASGILTVRFILGGSDANFEGRIKSVEAIGEVCHSLLSEKNEHRLGIRFTEITEEDRMAIADFVSKCRDLQRVKE